MTTETTVEFLDGDASSEPGQGGDVGAAGLALTGAPTETRTKTSKQTHRRREAAIHAYIGPNGAGKSASMIRDTLPSLDAGRTVLSTVPLLDSVTGEPHPFYVPLTDWSQMLDAEHVDVLFDEITGIASSRASMGMPVQVQAMLDKLRKSDIVLRWSAPAWSRADVTIRGVTQAVTDCRGYLTNRADMRGTATQARLWPPKRLFRLRTFPTTDFAEFTDGKRDKMKRAQTVEWWWGPGSRVFDSYDTYAAVNRVGEVLDSGRCAHCGGKRAVPNCTCDNQPGRRSGIPVVASTRSQSLLTPSSHPAHS